MPLEQTVYIVNNSGKIISSVRLLTLYFAPQRGWAADGIDRRWHRQKANTYVCSRESSSSRYSKRPRHPTKKRRHSSRANVLHQPPSNERRPLRHLDLALPLTDSKITTRKKTRSITPAAVIEKASLESSANTKTYTMLPAVGPTMQPVMLAQDAVAPIDIRARSTPVVAASKGRLQVLLP